MALGSQAVALDGEQMRAQYFPPEVELKAHCAFAPEKPAGAPGQEVVQLGVQIAPSMPVIVMLTSLDEQEVVYGSS